MQPRVHYATAPDGARIAYTVEGEGPALAFLAASVTGNMTLFRQQPGVAAYFERIATGRSVVQLDFRGYGLSTREVNNRSLMAFTSDLRAVLDALRLDTVDLHTAGHRASVGIRFAVESPERVRKLLLVNPIIYDAPAQPAPGIIELMRNNYSLWLELNAARLGEGKSVEERAALVQFFRACVQPAALLAEIDASDYFADWEIARSVLCPVLVAYRKGTSFWESERFAQFAAAFPNGQFQEITEGTGALFGDSRAYEKFIDSFFRPAVSVSRPLSPRELEVVDLLATGDSNDEISRPLGLSVRTVERHLTNIYNKLGARRRADAVAWSVQRRGQ